jgi:hypothetical protein
MKISSSPRRFRSLPHGYRTVAEAFERDAEPYGHASVDIGSDVNARWRDSDVPGGQRTLHRWTTSFHRPMS